MEILNQYEEGSIQTTEYTKDGVNVSHVVKVPIQSQLTSDPPTIEERILTENQYQTALLEMTTGGVI